MINIPLTKGYTAIIDDADYAVTKYPWYIQINGGNLYARSTTYGMLHNFLMKPSAGFFVDHIDGNGLNCQRYNMRIGTKSQNNANRIRNVVNPSGYRGVIAHHGKWKAYCYFKDRTIYGGVYDTPEEAALARDKLAKQYHGKFARLNYD